MAACNCAKEGGRRHKGMLKLRGYRTTCKLVNIFQASVAGGIVPSLRFASRHQRRYEASYAHVAVLGQTGVRAA